MFKICFFTSLENSHLLFMLEEHCYITDASITTFKNELFNDLVVLQTKMINVIAKF